MSDFDRAITQAAREIRGLEQGIVQLQKALTTERQAREQAEQERDRLRARMNMLEAQVSAVDIELIDAELSGRLLHDCDCGEHGHPDKARHASDCNALQDAMR